MKLDDRIGHQDAKFRDQQVSQDQVQDQAFTGTPADQSPDVPGDKDESR